MMRALRAWLWLVCLLTSGYAAAQSNAIQATPTSETILLVVDATTADSKVLSDLLFEHVLELRGQWRVSALEAHCLEVVPDGNANRARLLQQLAADKRVQQIHANQLHYLAGMPARDPYFDLQARTRAGGVQSILRHGTGKHIRIAMIDTGVDVTHPDLIGQIAEAVNFVGGAADAVPAEFHGTAVAGLISAMPSNGIGIHGLAPDAEMLALRACWEPTYGYGLCNTNTLAQALDYAIEVRARIINMSLAGPEDALLAQLVNRAIELGAIVFGAVGEDPTQSFPASIPGVIGVLQGSLETEHGAGRSFIVPGKQLLSTVPNNRYDFVSGSSFATAHASGVAAVMLEQQPHLQADALVDWLQRLHGNNAVR
jgi:subtilisin family serine protease